MLATSQRVLGLEHPSTLTSMSNLASTLQAMGELATARELLGEALTAQRRVLGERHPGTTISAWNLFGTLDQLGDRDAAGGILKDHLMWLLRENPAELGADQREIQEYVATVLGGGPDPSAGE